MALAAWAGVARSHDDEASPSQGEAELAVATQVCRLGGDGEAGLALARRGSTLPSLRLAMDLGGDGEVDGEGRNALADPGLWPAMAKEGKGGERKKRKIKKSKYY